MGKLSGQCVARLSAEPAVRDVGQKQVMNLRLVCDSTTKRKDGERGMEPVWMDAEVWSDAPGFSYLVANLHKGDQVEVRGYLQLREYTRQDGTKGAALEMKRCDVSLVGQRNTERQAQPEPAARPAQPVAVMPGPDEFDDDPFGDS